MCVNTGFDKKTGHPISVTRIEIINDSNYLFLTRFIQFQYEALTTKKVNPKGNFAYGALRSLDAKGLLESTLTKGYITLSDPYFLRESGIEKGKAKITNNGSNSQLPENQVSSLMVMQPLHNLIGKGKGIGLDVLGKRGVGKKPFSPESETPIDESLWAEILQSFENKEMYQSHKWGSVKQKLKKILGEEYLEALVDGKEISIEDVLDMFCKSWYERGVGRPTKGQYSSMGNYFKIWANSLGYFLEKDRKVSHDAFLTTLYERSAEIRGRHPSMTEDLMWALKKVYKSAGNPPGKSVLLATQFAEDKGMESSLERILGDWEWYKKKYNTWIAKENAIIAKENPIDGSAE